MRRLHPFIRAAAFVATLAASYAAAVGVLSYVEINDRTVMERLVVRPLRPGAYGHALARFREIETYGDVDVVFAGSSHAYRGFDPRIFAAAGLRTFNIGSYSQTPLNSYYLLKRYWNDLRPKLVVYELYPHVLGQDGIESFYDLAINTPLSWEMVQMALATRDFRSINALASLVWVRLGNPLTEARQSSFNEERYVAGGYVERTDTLRRLNVPDSVNLSPSSDQLGYLRRLVRLVRRRGARFVMISQPVPAELRAALGGYDAMLDRMRELAASEGVPYIDLTSGLGLDTHTHFFDDNHLNAAGVKRFNEALLDSLNAHGLLPR